MILISHRGNIDGRIIEKENTTTYIDDAIKLGYDVEIDVWYINSKFYLGHDKSEYEISYDWIIDRCEKLWVHCKNVECMNILLDTKLNCFWHENDTITLTSKNYIWAYPGKQPIKNSIAVLPEINDDDISQCIGVCSNNVLEIKNKIK